MCKPFEGVSIQRVMSEIISSQSALHMEPDPIECPKDEIPFLAYTDGYVKHSLEHSHAAFDKLNKVQNKIDRAYNKATHAICFPDKNDPKKVLREVANLLQEALWGEKRNRLKW